MPRQKSWVYSEVVNGICSVKISSWKYFNSYVFSELMDYKSYIFRGQRDSTWKLYSSFDRLIDKAGKRATKSTLAKHLKNFQSSIRGRRGNNPIQFEDENSWWSLGQHFGLSTPLLDWSHSPYVAAYFAYEANKEPKDRIVFAINYHRIISKSKELLEKGKKSRDQVILFFQPNTDDNPRLLSQKGIFSKNPINTHIEEWVEEHFKNESEEQVLIRVILPNDDRDVALKNMNRMNINHLTLFPDIFGACIYSNINLSIQGY